MGGMETLENGKNGEIRRWILGRDWKLEGLERIFLFSILSNVLQTLRFISLRGFPFECRPGYRLPWERFPTEGALDYDIAVPPQILTSAF
jgi:hypothetical protein